MHGTGAGKAEPMNHEPAFFTTIIARFKEPSSWAAIAAALAVFGVDFTEGAWQLIAQAGVALAALIAFIVPEKA